MKKLIILVALFSIVSVVFAKKADPTNAKYFIKGDYAVERVGHGIQYHLSNVTSSGISFSYQNVWRGERNDGYGDIEFIFDNAKTDYPGGFGNNKLQFWAFDEEIQEWQPDVEVRQGTRSSHISKEIVIMLVLDCSSSLSSDFYRVKNSAKSFINKMYAASPNGNIKIGIIGFNTISSTNNHIFNICPLTVSSYQGMITFIDNLQIANGTALYYSIDKAITMMQRSKINTQDFQNAFMLVFSDGIDNTSVDYDNNILTVDDYYSRAKTLMKTTQIGGKHIESHIIAVKGSDIATEAQEKKFDRVLGELTDDYRKIYEFSELENIFNEIAERLIISWQSLRCYIPAARVGKVCWTLGNFEETPAPKPIIQKNKALFLGANIGGGFSYCGVPGGNYSIGMEFAYPITSKFGLGAYFSYEGYILENHIPAGVVGLQLTAGDYTNHTAFIGGLGAGFCKNGYTFDMRAGFLTQKGFYCFGSFEFGGTKNNYYSYYYDYNDYYYYEENRTHSFLTNISLHFGFNFGRGVRVN